MRPARLRSAVLVVALGTSAGGCGDDAEQDWDRASLGKAANTLIQATRARDAPRICSYFPFEQNPSVTKHACLVSMRSRHFCTRACSAEDTDFLTTPTPGRVVDAVQYAPSAWSVVVQGPPNPKWTAADDAMTPRAIHQAMLRAARRGYQCVTVASKRDEPLKAIADSDCIGYVQVREAVGKRPDVQVIR